MRAHRVVTTGRDQVEVQEIELPAPGPKEVLLEAECTLISAGTQLAGVRGETQGGPATPERPRSLGYSFVGIVRAVGAAATGWRVGQRMAGQAPHASWALVPADRQFVPVPEGLTPEQASFVAHLAITLNAIRLAHIQIGEPVAVLGQGLIGQLAAQFARINGGRPVIALDVLDSRLEVARAGGADETINVRRAGTAEALAAAVYAAAGSDAGDIGGIPDGLSGPRVVIEATGRPQPVVTALKIAGHGARVVLLGSTRGLVDQWDPYADVHRKALTIIGAHSPSSHPLISTFWNPWTVPANVRVGFNLIQDGSLRLDRLITHRLPGRQAPDAFARLATAPDEHLGVLLDWRKQAR